MTKDSSPTSPPREPILTAEDGFLTKRELSLRLKKTPRCIETWMKRRYLPYIKIGHSVFFRWPDVIAALRRFEVH
ncbi:MAG: hypothetical protein J0M24_01190 [Verrucomicrobia bacterium]|nr:hypothetical protein [Verrucomicrobiota bacterium]